MGSMNILIKNLKSSNKNGCGFMHIWQRDITSIDVGLLKKSPCKPVLHGPNGTSTASCRLKFATAALHDY